MIARFGSAWLIAAIRNSCSLSIVLAYVAVPSSPRARSARSARADPSHAGRFEPFAARESGAYSSDPPRITLPVREEQRSTRLLHRPAERDETRRPAAAKETNTPH